MKSTTQKRGAIHETKKKTMSHPPPAVSEANPQGTGDEDEESGTGTRRRIQTIKGKGYQLEFLHRNCTAAQRAWKKHVNKIESKLADGTEITALQEDQRRIKELFEELTNANDILRDNVESKTDEHAADMLERTWDKENLELFRRINERISEVQLELGSVR